MAGLLASETKAFDAKERFILCGAIACFALELPSLEGTLEGRGLVDVVQTHKVARVEPLVLQALQNVLTVPNGANLMMVESVLPRLHRMVEFLSASQLQKCAKMLLDVYDDPAVANAAQDVHVSLDLHGRSVGINALGFGDQFYVHTYLGKRSVDNMRAGALGLQQTTTQAVLNVPSFFSAVVHVSYSWGVTAAETQLFPRRFAYNADLLAVADHSESFVRKCHSSLLCASIVDSLQPTELLHDAMKTRVQLAMKLGQVESAHALAFVGSLGSHSGRMLHILTQLASDDASMDDYMLWGCVYAQTFYADKVKPRLREIPLQEIPELCLQILLQAGVALGVVEYHCRMRAMSYEQVEASIRGYGERAYSDKLTFAVCPSRTRNYVNTLLRSPNDMSVLRMPLRKNAAAEAMLRNAEAFAIPFWEGRDARVYAALTTITPQSVLLWQNVSACLLQSLCTYDVCVANVCRTVATPSAQSAADTKPPSTPQQGVQPAGDFATPAAGQQELFCGEFVAELRSATDEDDASYALETADRALDELCNKFWGHQQTLPTCGYPIDDEIELSVGISSRVEAVLEQFRSYSHGNARDGPVPVFVAVDLLFHDMVETSYVCPVHVYTTQDHRTAVRNQTIVTKLASQQFFASSVQRGKGEAHDEPLRSYGSKNRFTALYRDFEEHSEWVHSHGYKYHPKLLHYMAHGFWLAVKQLDAASVDGAHAGMGYLPAIFDVLTTPAFVYGTTLTHPKLTDEFKILSSDTQNLIPTLNFLKDDGQDILEYLQQPSECLLILWSSLCASPSDAASLRAILVDHGVTADRADIFASAMQALWQLIPDAMSAYETVRCQSLFGHMGQNIYDSSCFDDAGNSLLVQRNAADSFARNSARRSLELSFFATGRATRLSHIAGLPPLQGDVAPDVRYSNTKGENVLAHGKLTVENNYVRELNGEAHCLLHNKGYLGAWMAFCVPLTLPQLQGKDTYSPAEALPVLQDMYGHASKFRTFVRPADVACHVAMLLQICTGIRLYGLPPREPHDNARLYTLRRALNCVMAWCDNVIMDGEEMSFLAHLAQDGLNASFLLRAQFLRAALAEEFEGCASERVSASACVAYSALCAVEVMFGLCATGSGTARSGRLTMPSTYVAQLMVHGQPREVKALFHTVQKHSTLYPTDDPQVGSILQVLQTLRGHRT